MSRRGLLIQVELSRQSLDDRVVALKQQCEEGEISIHCAKGCANCCRLAVQCSFPEAVAMADALTPAHKQRLLSNLPQLEHLCGKATDLKHFLKLYRDETGGCPFVDDQHSCSVYPHRPLSCRALLSTRPAQWCAVDFSTLHPLEKKAFLSSLNPEVVAYPGHYLDASQREAAALETAICDHFERKYGFFLTGNLQWLIGLELQHQLGEHLDEDSSSIKNWLLELQQHYPYLLHVEIPAQH